MRRHLAVLAVPFAVVAFAGCGDQTKEVEKSVANLLKEGGFPNSKVDCPSSVEVKKGSTFDCKVTGSQATKTTIRINDDAGDDLTLIKVDAPTKGTAGSQGG